jgi:hypothetical protein
MAVLAAAPATPPAMSSRTSRGSRRSCACAASACDDEDDASAAAAGGAAGAARAAAAAAAMWPEAGAAAGVRGRPLGRKKSGRESVRQRALPLSNRRLTQTQQVKLRGEGASKRHVK